MPGSSPSRLVGLTAPAGVVLGVLAGVLNLSFLLESLLPGPARVGSTVVSDLSTPGHPWNWLFRTADIGSGVCLLGLCVLLLGRRSDSKDSSARFAWLAATAATAVFAVSTVVAATVTETCAPSFDASCPAGTSTTDLVHDVVSSIGSTAGVLAALAFAILLRHRRWLAALHGAAFAAAASSGLLFVAWQAQPHDDLSGWAQRAQIIALSAWFAVLGATVKLGPATRVTSSSDDRRERMRA